jgi:hypothetical protein
MRCADAPEPEIPEVPDSPLSDPVEPESEPVLCCIAINNVMISGLNELPDELLEELDEDESLLLDEDVSACNVSNIDPFEVCDAFEVSDELLDPMVCNSDQRPDVEPILPTDM